jgi:type IV fimbrial biogenesis protein FimT
MLNTAHNQFGVSLLELMVAVAIGSILLLLGIPSFQSWIQNTQVRTAAESVLNGMQIARAEAVRRNTNVRFNMTDATGMVTWTVGCETVLPMQANGDECPAVIQSRAGNEGGTNARVGISVAAYPTGTPPSSYFNDPGAGAGLPAGVTFNGLGRVPAKNLDGTVNSDDITLVSVTNAQSSTARRMVIVVRNGGQIRMCDPALQLSSNPQGCS